MRIQIRFLNKVGSGYGTGFQNIVGSGSGFQNMVESGSCFHSMVADPDSDPVGTLKFKISLKSNFYLSIYLTKSDSINISIERKKEEVNLFCKLGSIRIRDVFRG